MKPYNLGFASLGNGISVYDSNREEHGDYKKIAHISVNREVTYYVKRLPDNERTIIETYAREEDPNVSQTQESKVFKERPKKVSS